MTVTPAPPWVQPARAWSLDGRVMGASCPAAVLDLVALLLAPPVYLLLGTLDRPVDQQWLAEEICRYGSVVTDDLIGRVADALVWTWCGVPRWFAVRVWREILGGWAQFDGELAGRGVDPLDLSPVRATRLVWATLARWHGYERDQGAAWRAEIETPPAPPPGARVRRPDGRRAAPKVTAGDVDAWRSTFAAVGGRAR